MIEKMNPARVKGFLRAEGQTVVNEAGEEVILAGWGLGNWLLCEGYMWLSYESPRFDRPRRIETVIRELTGSAYSEAFWTKFRDNYITEADIAYMKELGYNSLRIPFNWRLFLEEEPGLIWREEGFHYLDLCLDWCEKYGIYAFLDLHGAPGGQTGANIDDCADDVPRLLLDGDKWEKGIALWGELARRYCDRWIVGGYDLLNEPIRPAYGDQIDYDFLLPELARFYEEAIVQVRRYDQKHMLSIEGHHWSTDTGVFHKRYDDNMVIHFHRYACLPQKESFDEFLALSEKLDQPLWLGETGENINTWYAAMYPLSAKLGIGYNLWPWKKMDCTNSPCSIPVPEGWDEILEYTKGGKHPGYERAQQILNQFLENIKLVVCVKNEAVTNHVMRKAPFTIRATDFEEPAAKASADNQMLNAVCPAYRPGTGITLTEEKPAETSRFAFDCQWDRFLIHLKEGDQVSYLVYEVKPHHRFSFTYKSEENCQIEVLVNGEVINRIELPPAAVLTASPSLLPGEGAEKEITLAVIKGSAEIAEIKVDSNS